MNNSWLSIKRSLNKIRKVNRKAMFIILGALTAVILFISIYLSLVPFIFYHGGFRPLIAILLLLWSTPLIFVDKNKPITPINNSWWQIPFYTAIAYIGVMLILTIGATPLFNATAYRDLINVHDNQTFANEVENYDTMQIPVVDKALAQKLGDKKLGEDNLGSQYNVGKYYMICHNNNLYWIAPIEFNGFFPWTNRRTSPGYVMINANDPADVRIVKYELHYTDSSYLWEDLNRQNYFGNLTAWRANEAHLELTDEGEPRYVETVYVNRIGLTGGYDVAGIIITNPNTGASEYCDYLQAPSWINHVITEDVIVDQLNYWGTYVNGFFNSIFAKKDVLEVSTGINYVYSNGNMYLQTGMTSVGGDESIVGVMMVDMRTKEAFFYRIGGATEYAAAQSAIGKDQEKRYTSSDPIMINLDGVPTYFIMLKDDEGLVKRYAYVNVSDYRLVSTADTKTSALIEYKKLIQIENETPAEEYEIADIRQVIIGGNTVYYIKLKATATTPSGWEEYVFSAPIELDPSLPFKKAGDKIKIRYEYNNGIYEISSIEK
jgi:hypothetical protein